MPHVTDTLYTGTFPGHWSVLVSSEPSTEPISTAEAKTHLRVDDSADDTYIDVLVKVARQRAETLTRRALITQTLVFSMDDFPTESIIKLPRPPLQSITSIQYTDEDNNTQTFAASKYQTDTNAEPGRVALEPDETWPDTRSETLNAVQITYKAGYGDNATDVPEGIIHAMQLYIGTWYAFREDILAGSVNSLPENAAAKQLLNHYAIEQAY